MCSYYLLPSPKNQDETRMREIRRIIFRHAWLRNMMVSKYHFVPQNSGADDRIANNGMSLTSVILKQQEILARDLRFTSSRMFALKVDFHKVSDSKVKQEGQEEIRKNIQINSPICAKSLAPMCDREARKNFRKLAAGKSAVDTEKTIKYCLNHPAQSGDLASFVHVTNDAILSKSVADKHRAEIAEKADDSISANIKHLDM
ncbi:hypothetical protein B0H14DRAFT_2654286 [Mycena olivaceomarginata]|nr:hypothetical protein B0H14DRAFT_2654286 [Mycena olivaceomarginata]